MFVNALANPVAVATIDAVAVINVASAGILSVELKNTGANALDAFEVWGKIAPGGQVFKLADLAAHYTGPAYPITRASASPVALAAAASVWFFMDVSALAEVTLKASSAVGATTLDVRAAVKSVR